MDNFCPMCQRRHTHECAYRAGFKAGAVEEREECAQLVEACRPKAITPKLTAVRQQLDAIASTIRARGRISHAFVPPSSDEKPRLCAACGHAFEDHAEAPIRLPWHEIYDGG